MDDKNQSMDLKLTKPERKAGLCKKPGRDQWAEMSKEERKAFHVHRIAARRHKDFMAYQKSKANPAIVRPNLGKDHPRRNQPIRLAYIKP